jgi:hypothetical protein
MTEAEIKELFPNLDLEGFAFTSSEDWFYNCFAWAAGDNKHIWQPSKSSFYVWFTRSNSESLENFIENYGYIGYKEITESPEFEPEFEKIAIYVDDGGQPSHAARQTNSGAWTSKLGRSEDIEHKTLECLEGEDYGKVKVILKRPRKEIQMPKKETEKTEEFKTLVKNLMNVPKKEIDEQLKLERQNKQKESNKKRK